MKKNHMSSGLCLWLTIFFVSLSLVQSPGSHAAEKVFMRRNTRTQLPDEEPNQHNPYGHRSEPPATTIPMVMPSMRVPVGPIDHKENYQAFVRLREKCFSRLASKNAPNAIKMMAVDQLHHFLHESTEKELDQLNQRDKEVTAASPSKLLSQFRNTQNKLADIDPEYVTSDLMYFYSQDIKEIMGMQVTEQNEQLFVERLESIFSHCNREAILRLSYITKIDLSDLYFNVLEKRQVLMPQQVTQFQTLLNNVRTSKGLQSYYLRAKLIQSLQELNGRSYDLLARKLGYNLDLLKIDLAKSIIKHQNYALKKADTAEKGEMLLKIILHCYGYFSKVSSQFALRLHLSSTMNKVVASGMNRKAIVNSREFYQVLSHQQIVKGDISNRMYNAASTYSLGFISKPLVRNEQNRRAMLQLSIALQLISQYQSQPDKFRSAISSQLLKTILEQKGQKSVSSFVSQGLTIIVGNDLSSIRKNLYEGKMLELQFFHMIKPTLQFIDLEQIIQNSCNSIRERIEAAQKEINLLRRLKKDQLNSLEIAFKFQQNSLIPELQATVKKWKENSGNQVVRRRKKIQSAVLRNPDTIYLSGGPKKTPLILRKSGIFSLQEKQAIIDRNSRLSLRKSQIFEETAAADSAGQARPSLPGQRTQIKRRGTQLEQTGRISFRQQLLQKGASKKIAEKIVSGSKKRANSERMSAVLASSNAQFSEDISHYDEAAKAAKAGPAPPPPPPPPPPPGLQLLSRRGSDLSLASRTVPGLSITDQIKNAKLRKMTVKGGSYVSLGIQASDLKNVKLKPGPSSIQQIEKRRSSSRPSESSSYVSGFGQTRLTKTGIQLQEGDIPKSSERSEEQGATSEETPNPFKALSVQYTGRGLRSLSSRISEAPKQMSQLEKKLAKHRKKSNEDETDDSNNKNQT